jgi:hypothetical protein
VGAGAGCATSDLSVQRVAVYRNGVAYFERAGHPSADELRFRMKSADVGDFLATLAVVDGSGTSVRAAAFPSHFDTATESRETVVLTLDGPGRDLRLGYVAQSPVWKPSYRLVIHSGGTASLQVWGIVENLSGEDWKEVRLSLVAGAPIAFQSDLGTPVMPTRPLVSDEGESNSTVPRGVQTVESRAAGHPQSGTLFARGPMDASVRVPAQAAPRASAYGYGLSATVPAGAASAPGSPTVLAGSSTRYDVGRPVTIRDGGAAMVLAMSHPVEGEVVMLFAPDPGVADSAAHPFRAACFKNSSGGTLERGPIAMFDESTFLGQGVVDPLPAGAIATLPYALERSVEVRREATREEGAFRVLRIEEGDLFVQQDRLTSYRVSNGGDEPAKVYIAHARMAESNLVSPPAGTKEDLAHGSALVPVGVAAHATEEVVVDEIGSAPRTADWLTDAADQAIRKYLADPRSDPEAVKKLSAAWVIRRELVKREGERYSLQQESYTLGQAPPKASGVNAKIAANSRHIAELQTKIAQLTAQFHDALLGVRVPAP